jgi:RHH-type proline utilization regulon transcriptional repressor/proline dehydrogenase/delta 1-pyrroline-5-carboxylate dehydrogenase
VERGHLPHEAGAGATADTDGADAGDATQADAAPQPFLEFAQSVQPQSVLRAAITSAYRRPETECVPVLLEQARCRRRRPMPPSRWREPWRPGCASRK